MRVTLIVPPVSQDTLYGKLKKVGSYHQPLGVAYLAAYLRAKGHKAAIIDANILNLSIENILARTKGDVVGISVNALTAKTSVAIANSIKQEKGIPVVVGGPMVSAIPEYLMSNQCIDYGIIGEGEQTIYELVAAIEEKKEVSSVHGLIYRSNKSFKNYSFKYTQARKPIRDLDTIPFPARNLLPPLSLYRPTPLSSRNEPCASMISSRGCPYKCTFCDRSVFGNALRMRSVENVTEEMMILKSQYKVREIKFWDDVFNIDGTRLVNLCKEIIGQHVDLPWTCICRINNVTDEQLSSMKKAGCWQIAFGIESGSNDILKKMNKGLSIRMIKDTVRKVHSHGIKVRGFFMLGFPGETKKTMEQSIALANSLPFDGVSYSLTVPYPNTELFRSIKLSERKWECYGQNNPNKQLFVADGLSKQILKQYYNKAYRSFYLRPSYIMQKLLSVRSIRDVVQNVKAASAIFGMK